MKESLKINLRNRIRTVMWITFFWTLISLAQLAFEYLVLHEYGVEHGWIQMGQFREFIIINTLTFAIIGLVGGIAIVFFLQRWFRTLPYGLAILYGIITYSVLFFLLTCLNMILLIMVNYDLSQLWGELGKSVRFYFTSLEFVKYFVFWLLVLTATLVGLLVADKYGPGVLSKFLLGRYFHPKREERIFMFLDLKGSTTIAEKLGELKYFEFLKETIRIVTPAIMNHRGEVYQYVGDEIVISWPMKAGLHNTNCIRCFSEIQERLSQNAGFFENRFDALPVYKAGLHCGKVIAGEIGVIKKDITYSGDVLNTTSRIQGKCNELDTHILVSGTLISKFPPTAINFKPERVGVFPLRGKENAIELYTL